MSEKIISTVALFSVLTAGCWDAGKKTEDLDPVKLSAYLFAGEPDWTSMNPDPDDPDREVTWEFRILERVTSYLVKTCTQSSQATCHHLALGYIDFQLDGRVTVALSLPAITGSGIRGSLADFVGDSNACRIQYDPEDGTLFVVPDQCSPDAAAELLGLLDKWNSSPELESMSCAIVALLASGCLKAGVEVCSIESESPLTTLIDDCPDSPAFLERCQPRHEKRCREGQVWWFDSCGRAEEPIQDCPSGCANGACMEDLRVQCMSSHHDLERPGTIIEYDSCGFSAKSSTEDHSRTQRLNQYSCASYGDGVYLDESGAETIYPFFAERSGQIHVTLTDDSTRPDGSPGDLDLFLLKGSCQASDCLQYGASSLYAEVEKGHCYYIVVDGYDGSFGAHEIYVSDPYCHREQVCQDRHCGHPCEWEAQGIAFEGYCSQQGACVPLDSFDHCQEWLYSDPAKVEFTKSEVTVGQYALCVSQGACSELEAPLNQDLPWNHPVTRVTWLQAKSYCEWRQGRLPNHGEWFLEASNDTDYVYPWGQNEPTCDHVVWRGERGVCGDGSLQPVCSKVMGNSISGLCDMIGNAWEWVDYLVEGYAMIVGGTSASSNAQMLTARTYMHTEIDRVNPGIGFRCVRDPD